MGQHVQRFNNPTPSRLSYPDIYTSLSSSCTFTWSTNLREQKSLVNLLSGATPSDNMRTTSRQKVVWVKWVSIQIARSPHFILWVDFCMIVHFGKDRCWACFKHNSNSIEKHVFQNTQLRFSFPLVELSPMHLLMLSLSPKGLLYCNRIEHLWKSIVLQTNPTRHCRV